jgi:hypothetical protein
MSKQFYNQSDQNYISNFDNSSCIESTIKEEILSLKDCDSKISLKPLKLPKIMNELLENEEIYVNTLEKGIKNYVNIFKESGLVPRKMQGLRYHLFSNIENIYEFHRDVLLPKLRGVEDNLVKIADLFIELINKDQFYCYIQYAVYNKRSEELCRANGPFFEVRFFLKMY